MLDVDIRAEIADIRSACVYAKDKNGASKLVVAVAPTIIAARGPANENRKADFQYFVSVVGADRTILNKQLFPVNIVFPGQQHPGGIGSGRSAGEHRSAARRR